MVARKRRITCLSQRIFVATWVVHFSQLRLHDIGKMSKTDLFLAILLFHGPLTMVLCQRPIYSLRPKGHQSFNADHNIFARHRSDGCRSKSHRKQSSYSNDDGCATDSNDDDSASVDSFFGYCLFSPQSIRLMDLVFRTDVNEIDQFFVEGRLVDGLRDFVDLIQTRVDNRSDREILRAIMVQNATLAQTVLRPGDSDDTTSGVVDRKLVDNDACLEAKVSAFIGLFNLILSFLVPALARFTKIGRAVADLLLKRYRLFFDSMLVIFQRSGNPVLGSINVFLGLLRDISIAAIVDTIDRQVDGITWLIVGITLGAELAVFVASGGASAAALLAIRVASAGVAFYDMARNVWNAIEICGETSQPSPSPISVFGPSPRPTFRPRRQSGVFGDPHLSTFDRLRFDCQAQGIFTMLTSLEDSRFKIQEKFTSVNGSNVCSQASVSTGIVVQEVGLPTIQLSVPTGDSTGANVLPNGCPIDFFLNGSQRDLMLGSDNPLVQVQSFSNDIRIVHRDTDLEIAVSIRQSSAFGCFFLVQVFLPLDYRLGETLLGLLGTPNDNRNDDWVDPNGNSYLPPQNEEQSVFGPAYNYCVDNWCIRDEEASAFTLRRDESFSSLKNGCDNSYADDIETAIANASVELQEVCGGSLFCFIDGICGSVEDAATVLQDEALVQQQAPSASPLRSEMPSLSPSSKLTTTVPSTYSPTSQAPSLLSDTPTTEPTPISPSKSAKRPSKKSHKTSGSKKRIRN